MTLGGPLREHEGDAGFDERLIRLSDDSHAFVVSHIHTMQGRTVVIRLGYDLGPLRDRMIQFFLMLLIAIPLALVLAAVAGQSIAKRALRAAGTNDIPRRTHYCEQPRGTVST